MKGYSLTQYAPGTKTPSGRHDVPVVIRTDSLGERHESAGGTYRINRLTGDIQTAKEMSSLPGTSVQVFDDRSSWADNSRKSASGYGLGASGDGARWLDMYGNRVYPAYSKKYRQNLFGMMNETSDAVSGVPFGGRTLQGQFDDAMKAAVAAANDRIRNLGAGIDSRPYADLPTRSSGIADAFGFANAQLRPQAGLNRMADEMTLFYGSDGMMPMRRAIGDDFAI